MADRGGRRAKLGPGLSLNKFAKAKQSTYDLKAKKEKQLALNAKQVNKYRKLQKRLQGKLEPPLRVAREAADEEAEAAAPEGSTAQPARPPPTLGGAREQEGAGAAEETDARTAPHAQQQAQLGPRGKRRPISQLQRIAAGVQEKKAEEQRARQEQQRQADERRLQLQEQQRARRQRSKSMFKRTGSGQPVMKFRLERVLEQLQP